MEPVDSSLAYGVFQEVTGIVGHSSLIACGGCNQLKQICLDLEVMFRLD